MGRFLIWLSGANPEILERAKTDRAKYQGMGGAVLTTATLAAFSMFFAMRMAVKAPVWGAVLISAVWFLAILNLDRWLVTSLQRSEQKRDILKIAIPRLLLALLFGFIISTPLMLQIFNPEVEAEVKKIRFEQTEQFQHKLDTGDTGKKITEVQNRETALLATISSGGTVVDTEGDKTVIALRAQLKTWTGKRDKARSQAACELLGENCPQGTRKSGDGPRYRQHVAEQRDAQQQVDSFTKQVNNRIKDLQTKAKTGSQAALADAKTQLPGVQKELQRLRDLQADEQGAFETDNKANTGLLIRLRGLEQASEGSWTLFLWRALLFLLITTLECLPIFVKVLSLFGRESSYERVLAAFEEERVQLGMQAARKERQTGFMQTNDEVSYAGMVRAEREKTLRMMAQKTAAVEQEIAERALSEWRDRELRNLSHNLDRYVRFDNPAAEAAPWERQVPPPAPGPVYQEPLRPPEPRNGHRAQSRWARLRVWGRQE